MTRSEFIQAYGFEPPPGETTDDAPPATRPPLTGTSFRTVGNGATGREHETWGPPPPPPPSTADAIGGGAIAMGSAPSPVSPAMIPPPVREAVSNAVTGDASVSNPSIGPLSIPGLGIGPGKDAGFFERVGSNITDPRALKILGETMVSRDPAALEAVIKRNVPDAKFTSDDQGNRIVQVGDNPPMYLNRPGLHAQDVNFDTVQGLAAYLARGRTIPGLMWRAGVQSEADTAASHALGGKGGWVDPSSLATDVGITGLLGAGGTLLSGAARGFGNWLMQTGEDAGAAIRRTIAKEFGQTPTYGQVTGNPYQLKREETIANAGPPGAAGEMQGVHNDNFQTTQNNKQGLVAEAGGATPPTPGKPPVAPPGFQGDESSLGGQILDNVRQRYEQLTAAEKAAWDKLGPMSASSPGGQSVQFSPGVSGEIIGRTWKTIQDRFGMPQGPNGQYADWQLRNGGQQIVDALHAITGPTTTTSTVGMGRNTFNLGQLQDMRQNLERMAQNAPNNEVASIIRQMKGNVDDAVALAEKTQGAVTGNTQALADFKAANQATRDKYAFASPRGNDAASGFISDATRQNYDAAGNPTGYAMGGQDAVDTAFGRSSVVEPGGGTKDIVTHLQGQLGNDSPALNASRAIVAKRPLYGRNATPDADALPAGPGYRATSKNIDAQLNGPGREVSDQIFDQFTRDRLDRFRQSLDTLNNAYQTKLPRGFNVSGSGYAGMNLPNYPLPPWVTKGVSDWTANRQVRRAVAGGERPILAFPAGPPAPFVGPAARMGGLLGEQAGP